jgi:hypothetical protein
MGSSAALRSAWPALVTGGLALGLYVRTMAPGLTWAHHGADGGDLLAAALTRGVPHPTGYPTYMLLLAAAARLAPEQPARAGNWLSAVAAALAAALMADLARRTLAGQPWRNAAALTAGLVWATTPGLWSQAVITEVYAPHALAVIALLWLMWRWREAVIASRRGWPWLSAAGLVLGLGLGNHLTLALMAPGLIAWIWPLRQSVVHHGAWQARLLPLVAGALGLATYAYLPWAAGGVPPINWGNPRTFSGFGWLVSAAAYRELVFGVPIAYLPGRLAAWASETGRQLGGGVWGMLVALLGLWRLERTDRAWWLTTLLVALCYTVYAIGYNTTDSDVYLIPAWGMACLWIACGVSWIAQGVLPQGNPRWTIAVLLILTVGLPLGAAIRHGPEMDLSRDHAAREFIDAALSSAAPGALILVADDQPTFALWYARYGLRQRPDVIPINVHLLGSAWYEASLLRHHPALAAVAPDGKLPPLEEFAPAAVRRWPLYRAGSLDDAVTGLNEESMGALVLLTAP